MLLSQMVEEKSNKIIEVVAAAVPIEYFVRRQIVRDGRRLDLFGLIVWSAAGAWVIAR